MSRSRAIALLAIALAASCGGETVPANRPATHDSAGVRIVETRLDREALPEWRLSDRPSLEIGVVEGDSAYQLFRVSGVVRLSDGRVVVANGGTNELRVYSERGEHIRTVGGNGQGPGEYRGMRRVWLLPGDSLLVEDFLNARLTHYTPNLDLVRSRPIRELAPFVTPPPLGRFSDGRWVVTTARMVGEPPDPVEFVGLLITYAGDAQSADTLAELPSMPAYFEYCRPEQNAICRLNAPFAPSLAVALSGDTVFAGNGADFTIRVIDSGGGLAALWRVLAPPRPVTPEDIEHDRRWWVERARSDDQRSRIERTYRTVPIPGTMPAFADLTVDADGDLWVQEFRAAQDTVLRYLVFSPGGEILARLAAPADLEVHRIGRDYVLGVYTDAAGVEYVRMYELTRGDDGS